MSGKSRALTNWHRTFAFNERPNEREKTMGTSAFQINGSHNLVSMAPWVCQYVRTEPRAFTKKTRDRFAGEDVGCGQVVYVSPSFCRVRGSETQGNSQTNVPANTDDPKFHRQIQWVIQRESDQSLSRVLTALWLRFLWWKHIRDHAQREMEHYDDTWTRLEEYNDAVKQKAEPRLLTK